MEAFIEEVKGHTLAWVVSFVVHHNLCPFAKRVIKQGGLTLQVDSTQNTPPTLESLQSALKSMDKTPSIETLLLIYPFLLHDFFDYLDFIDEAEAYLIKAGYEGTYQLASFHPHYCFEGEAFDAPSNKTNQSPYPMIHILRETSLDQAIDAYGDTSEIPMRNKRLMDKLG